MGGTTKKDRTCIDKWYITPQCLLGLELEGGQLPEEEQVAKSDEEEVAAHLQPTPEGHQLGPCVWKHSSL